jgi:hypothetical protein
MCHDRLSQTTSTVLEKLMEKGVLEDALSCSLHKIGTSLVEKVVDTRLHLESTNQTNQDRV